MGLFLRRNTAEQKILQLYLLLRANAGVDF